MTRMGNSRTQRIFAPAGISPSTRKRGGPICRDSSLFIDTSPKCADVADVSRLMIFDSGRQYNDFFPVPPQVSIEVRATMAEQKPAGDSSSITKARSWRQQPVHCARNTDASFRITVFLRRSLERRNLLLLLLFYASVAPVLLGQGAASP